MQKTEYYTNAIEKRGINHDQVLTALDNEHSRVRQKDGRLKIYGWVEQRGYYMRVILTADGQLLNAFWDRDYTRKNK